MVLALVSCGGGSGGGGSRGGENDATNCSGGVSQIQLDTQVTSIAISEDVSHCYSFDSIAGGLYRITLTPLSGDADVAAFNDPVMDSGSVLSFSDNFGTTPDIIEINPDVSRVYIEVFGFIASTYNLIVASIKPTAVVPAKHEVALNQTVFLDGSASTSTRSSVISHSWKLLSKPAASTAVFPDQSGVVVDFVPDAFGDYVFELSVHDTILPSDPVTTTLSVNFYQTALNFEPVDAEYSDTLESVVLVSNNPDSLHRFNPSDRSLVNVSLLHTPKSVSISPDGLFAAVGHDQWISYVNLTSMTLVKTIPVTVNVFDLVLDGNGVVHMVGGNPYRSVDVATEIESPGQNVLGTMSSNATIKLNSDEEFIFSTDKVRVDVSDGIAAGLYRANFDSMSFNCKKIWLSEDFTRLFWRCGEVMKLYPTRQQDYAANGNLGGVGSRYRAIALDHSIESGEVVGIIEDVYHTDPDLTYDSNIRIYDDESLDEVRVQPLPLVANTVASFSAHGKFVFNSADGTQYIAITAVDSSAGLSTDQMIFTTEKSGDPIWINHVPVANAGRDRAANPAAIVDLDGGGSSDADANPLNFSWRIINAPVGSVATLVSPLSETPQITPDLTGEYLIGLTVNDGTLSSHEDVMKLSVATTTDSFLLQPGYDIFDAEYSESLGLIVGISSQDQALVTIDVSSFEQKMVALPGIGQAVSVSPDGLTAAVALKDEVSLINLSAVSLTVTHPVSLTTIGDVVLDGNGYVHLFEGFLSGFDEIRSIEIATGTETLSVGSLSPQIDNDTRARIHPNGNWIYGADNGTNPDDIEKYDVSSTPLNILYDSPYHGTYDMCGNLWFTETSPVIVTACGNIFSTDAIRALDMLHLGAISLGLRIEIVHMTHSTEAGKFALISEDKDILNPDLVRDSDVYIYSDTSPYPLIETQPLPDFDVGNTPFSAHGKFIFYNGNGLRYFAVVRANDSAPAIDEYGIYFRGN